MSRLWCPCTCRFTFAELEGFLETARACIPGTAEAIQAAVDHQARKVGAA